MTIYEFPLHERIRTWLRLEDLFEKARFFIQQTDARSHHAALLGIFEIVDVTARSELKSELIQELERQKSSLEQCTKMAWCHYAWAVACGALARTVLQCASASCLAAGCMAGQGAGLGRAPDSGSTGW